jgi:phosphoglucomutase
MTIDPQAGKPAPKELLINVGDLERHYYEMRPDPDNPRQAVSFGTSGHRGTSMDGSFTESHILAVTQAICDYRKSAGIAGPLFMGKDTHALSDAAQRTALEVLAAGGVETFIQRGGGFTPTPSISRAIISRNRKVPSARSDGIVITPSHNPPGDGGIKYNPPHGGPAETAVTGWIEKRANALLKGGNKEVKRIPFESALRAPTTHEDDFIMPYVRELGSVIDMDAIRSAKVKIGVDPLGGAAVHYWEPVEKFFGLDLTVVNPAVDPRFAFMTLDHDGKIRMDCSSAYAMAGLIELRGKFKVAFGTDPDADRHGIVTPSVGLMNPNHYLAVAIHYLLTHRPQWPADATVGKTLVSSGLIDRVVRGLGRKVKEVPVGFKWFAQDLHDGAICFGGEESAGASFLRRDGTAWSSDKDGLIMGLLAAEIVATTGKDPGEHYPDLAGKFGTPYYMRIDAVATPEQKAAFKGLTDSSVKAKELAGEPVLAKLTSAPGNNAPIGGLKVTTQNGWFAARPSGTENIYKIYAESFKSQTHLDSIVKEAQEIVTKALGV